MNMTYYGKLNLNGPEGQSLFYKPIEKLFNDEEAEKIGEGFDASMDKLVEIEHDRALVLTGSLIVENRLEEVLLALMPGFSKIREDTKFTFSIWIDILEAMCVLPKRILKCVNLIRKIRNAFAHGLNIDSLDILAMDEKKCHLVNSMPSLIHEFNAPPLPNDTYAIQFRALTSLTAAALQVYACHISELTKFIRTEDFYRVFLSSINNS
jgi:hypothetical protein